MVLFCIFLIFVLFVVLFLFVLVQDVQFSVLLDLVVVCVCDDDGNVVDWGISEYVVDVEFEWVWMGDLCDLFSGIVLVFVGGVILVV